MQRVSTKLSAVEQLQLLPQPGVVSRPVSFDRIYTLTDTHDALMYGCELAKMVPKQAYSAMGIDKTTWSRICGGEWDLDGRDVLQFDRIVGNDAYLLYLNHQHGYDLASMRKTMDDKDRQIADLRAELAAEKLRNETIIQYERQKDGRK
jgi:plasmid maintenance system antidote protein VapI